MTVSVDDQFGLQVLTIPEPTPDGGTHFNFVAVDAIAQWSELLGVTDPTKALNLILEHSEYLQTNPSLDGRQGEWAELLDMLTAPDEPDAATLAAARERTLQALHVTGQATEDTAVRTVRDEARHLVRGELAPHIRKSRQHQRAALQAVRKERRARRGS